MISSEQERLLKELVKVFLEENKKLNLSAMRDEESIWIGSVLDSLALLDYYKSLSAFSPALPAGRFQHSAFLDVGTGGGFPLLPLSICLPDAKICGMDSTQKKLDAIRRMADALHLEHVSLISGRAEELGHDKRYRDQFDIVTARALAPLNTLIEFCAPFVKPGGHLVAWKSMKIETELKESLLARAELRCHLVDSYKYVLPEGWGERQLLIFEKTGPTPAKYPRDIGVPKKTPLV
ncbi:MAG: 16S rRNA (guanine(527)-N(7))-methyltransferase RsmG [Candidatus Peregrinibacteria bacterium]|nr:16S rRNA (guanine(527)-N(7))-methyltransferase RsmG [Candidatus Peregrinibacteria bacterium]MCB9808725.1 16S rRNA (guanine(527)-N(7))-methyltransferase RsmG [Candidatus Peribacteria bacterium]